MPDGVFFALFGHSVAKLVHKGPQFVKAAVYVADDVKGAAFFPAVVPQGLAHDFRLLDLLGAAQDVHGSETFVFERFERTAQIPAMLAYGVFRQMPVGAPAVSFLTKLFRQGEHDGDRQAVLRFGEFHQRSAGSRLNAGRVHNGQFPETQAPGRDIVENVKGRLCRLQAVFVIGNDRPAIVRRKNFRRQEVFFREGRFAGTGRPDTRTAYPSGSNKLRNVSSPPRQGSMPTVAVRGSFAAASSGLW
jgi:hypothetical protein